MKKLNKFISGSVYKESLRKNRNFVLVITGVFLISIIFSVVGIISSDMVHERCGNIVNVYDVFFQLISFCLLSVPFMTFRLFGWMNSRKKSDFYHALPYTRENIFISSVASVMTWLIIALFLISASGIGIYAFFPSMYKIDFFAVFKTFLGVASSGLLMASSITLAMSITGTYFANITVSIMIIFFPRIALTVCTNCIVEKTGVLISENVPFILSENCNLIYKFFYSGPYSPIGFKSIIYTFLLAVFYTVIACVLFKNRKSETAHKSTPNKISELICGVVFSFIFVLLFFLDIYKNGFVVYDLITLFFIAVAYFVFVFIISGKSKTVMLKSVPCFFLPIILCALICCVLNVFVFKIMSFSPSPSDIEYVRLGSDSHSENYFSGSDGYIAFSDYANKKIGKIKNYDGETKLIVSNVLKSQLEDVNDKNSHYSREPLTGKNVYIKSGKREYVRRLYFQNELYSKLNSSYASLDEYKNIYMELPNADCVYFKDSNMSRIEISLDVYETLRSEVSELDFNDWYDFVTDSYFTIGFCVIIDKEKNDDLPFVFIPLSPEMTPKTMGRVLDEILDNDSKIDVCLNKLKNIDNLIESEGDNININISASIYSKGEYLSSVGGYYLRGSDEGFQCSAGENCFSKLIEIISAHSSEKLDTDNFVYVEYEYISAKGGNSFISAYFPISADDADYLSELIEKSYEMTDVK